MSSDDVQHLRNALRTHLAWYTATPDFTMPKSWLADATRLAPQNADVRLLIELLVDPSMDMDDRMITAKRLVEELNLRPAELLDDLARLQLICADFATSLLQSRDMKFHLAQNEAWFHLFYVAPMICEINEPDEHQTYTRLLDLTHLHWLHWAQHDLEELTFARERGCQAWWVNWPSECLPIDDAERVLIDQIHNQCRMFLDRLPESIKGPA